MRLARGGPPFHLTYCTNIHPAETWEEVLANLRAHTLAVKARVSPDAPFGLGLRLSARAAARLAEPAVLASFREFLADSDLYVFTINGFPYGAFHGATVKERVYLPDWLDDERLDYSDRLAHILAALLPTGVEGSVSTVPGCFRARASEPGAAADIAERLRRHVHTLQRLREETGQTVTLALEPEPHCLLETTDDAIAFFEEHVLSRAAVAAFAARAGLGGAGANAEETLRRHLGVCLDACHAAVEFESPDAGLESLARAGVRLLKVQVSAGLQVAPADAAARAALRRFADDVYLHQVVIQAAPDAGAHLDGGAPPLRRILDLPEALDAAARDVDARTGARTVARTVDGTAAGTIDRTAGAADEIPEEWRIHFHVPLFRERLGSFRGTQPFLVRLLELLGRSDICRHLEVETYTWDVLPEEFRREPVTDAIARELEWTIAHLPGSGASEPAP